MLKLLLVILLLIPTLCFADGSAIVYSPASSATPALDNLVSVAANTSLISDTDNTDDLGSSAKKWKDGYFAGNITVGGTVDGKDVSTLGVGDMAYANARIKIGTLTRDLSAADASVPYTGVGFQPKAVIFFYRAGNATSMGYGMDDGTTKNAFTTYGTTPLFDIATTLSIWLCTADGSAGQYGSIASFGADGFTLAWTKFGSTTGTGNITYMAYR